MMQYMQCFNMFQCHWKLSGHVQEEKDAIIVQVSWEVRMPKNPKYPVDLILSKDIIPRCQHLWALSWISTNLRYLMFLNVFFSKIQLFGRIGVSVLNCTRYHSGRHQQSCFYSAILWAFVPSSWRSRFCFHFLSGTHGGARCPYEAQVDVLSSTTGWSCFAKHGLP